MKKILILLFFFGSFGLATAQFAGSPEDYGAMENNPEETEMEMGNVSEGTPTTFDMPMQESWGNSRIEGMPTSQTRMQRSWGNVSEETSQMFQMYMPRPWGNVSKETSQMFQRAPGSRAMYNTNRGATETLCPSQRKLIACPNNRSKGYLYLPPGTRSCSVGADLGKYCYKGQPGQIGQESTIIGENRGDRFLPTRFQTESECRIAACGVQVDVSISKPGSCNCHSDCSGRTYCTRGQIPGVLVTLQIRGGKPPYAYRIENNKSSPFNSIPQENNKISIWFKVHENEREQTVLVRDSSNPKEIVRVTFKVPACSTEEREKLCKNIDNKADTFYKDMVAALIENGWSKQEAQEKAADETDKKFKETCKESTCFWQIRSAVGRPGMRKFFCEAKANCKEWLK